jgi:hypothetical protein
VPAVQVNVDEEVEQSPADPTWPPLWSYSYTAACRRSVDLPTPDARATAPRSAAALLLGEVPAPLATCLRHCLAAALSYRLRHLDILMFLGACVASFVIVPQFIMAAIIMSIVIIAIWPVIVWISGKNTYDDLLTAIAKEKVHTDDFLTAIANIGSRRITVTSATQDPIRLMSASISPLLILLPSVFAAVYEARWGEAVAGGGWYGHLRPFWMPFTEIMDVKSYWSAYIHPDLAKLDANATFTIIGAVWVLLARPITVAQLIIRWALRVLHYVEQQKRNQTSFAALLYQAAQLIGAIIIIGPVIYMLEHGVAPWLINVIIWPFLILIAIGMTIAVLKQPYDILRDVRFFSSAKSPNLNRISCFTLWSIVL